MKLSTIFHVVSRVQDVVLSLWLCHRQSNFHARVSEALNQLGCAHELGVQGEGTSEGVDVYEIMTTRNRGITKYRKLFNPNIA